MSKVINKYFLFLFVLLFPYLLFGQNNVPSWINADTRNVRYPSEQYYTGFSIVIITQNKNQEKATEEAKQTAMSDLSNRVRAAVSSNKSHKKTSIENNQEERIYSEFSSDVSVCSQVEVVGSKVETHFDQRENKVYAFAYVNKYELIGYYKSNLSVNINQIESFVKTAQDLENQNEKAKARQQLENAKPLFSKVRYAQDILTAIDVNASADDLQQAKTESLYNKLTQMQARLAQGVYVYVESNEDLFGKKVEIVANKVKAELAQNGCSFVDASDQADFYLKISVNVRISSQNDEGTIICRADGDVELYDTYKQKVVFGDAFSEKAGHASQEYAGRKAMEKTASEIVKKIKNWIQ